MKPAEQLALLADAEGRLRRFEEETAAVAARASGDAALDQLELQVGELEQAAQRRSSELRQLELEVAAVRDRARSHERALYDGSVRSPADLQRRQHELETLRNLIAAREEVELEQMEAVEVGETELAAAREQAAARRSAVTALRAQDQQRSPELAGERSAVEAEIAALTAGIPEAALRLYRRIAARRVPAVARVMAGSCSGCRLPLPHRILEEVRGDSLVTCENCERILLL